MAKRSPAVTAALIGALALIVAAVIGAILQPSWWRSPDGTVNVNFTVAGTVVDQSTNQSIRQSLISIVGRSETYVTEDNANFRIDIHIPLPSNQYVRLHVYKDS